MLEGREGCAYWKGQPYDTMSKALTAMCEDITERGVTPDFGDLSAARFNDNTLAQFILLYGIYHMDLRVLMESGNMLDYKRMSGQSDALMLSVMKKGNPLYVRKLSLPLGYEKNSAMQTCIFPKLKELYGKERTSIQTQRGKFPFDVVLSYLLDVTLFTPRNSPFSKRLKLFQILGSEEEAGFLDSYVSVEDMPRIEILAYQIACGDYVPRGQHLSIGDLRKGRYEAVSKEWFQGIDYIQMLLDCPPALKSDDYYTWLENAADASGHGDLIPQDVLKEPVIGEVEKTQVADAIAAFVETASKKPDLSEEDSNALNQLTALCGNVANPILASYGEELCYQIKVSHVVDGLYDALEVFNSEEVLLTGCEKIIERLSRRYNKLSARAFFFELKDAVHEYSEMQEGLLENDPLVVKMREAITDTQDTQEGIKTVVDMLKDGMIADAGAFAQMLPSIPTPADKRYLLDCLFEACTLAGVQSKVADIATDYTLQSGFLSENVLQVASKLAELLKAETDVVLHENGMLLLLSICVKGDATYGESAIKVLTTPREILIKYADDIKKMNETWAEVSTGLFFGKVEQFIGDTLEMKELIQRAQNAIPGSMGEQRHNMLPVAQVYCRMLDFDIQVAKDELAKEGYVNDLAFYKALPVYLREKGKGVDKEVLIQYCKALYDAYGTVELEYKK